MTHPRKLSLGGVQRRNAGCNTTGRTVVVHPIRAGLAEGSGGLWNAPWSMGCRGERSLPASDETAKRFTGAKKAQCLDAATGRGDATGTRSGSPCQDRVVVQHTSCVRPYTGIFGRPYTGILTLVLGRIV